MTSTSMVFGIATLGTPESAPACDCATGFREITAREPACGIATARAGEQKTNVLRSCTWFFERAQLRSEIFETLSTP